MLDFSCTAQTARVPAALQESAAQQVAQATLQNEMLAGQTDLGEQSESYSSHSSSSTSGDSVITDGLVCSPFTHEMLSDAAECISQPSHPASPSYLDILHMHSSPKEDITTPQRATVRLCVLLQVFFD